jgi:DUF1365 family protein
MMPISTTSIAFRQSSTSSRETDFYFIAFFDRDHGDGGTAPLRTQAETILRNTGCQPDGVSPANG